VRKSASIVSLNWFRVTAFRERLPENYHVPQLETIISTAGQAIKDLQMKRNTRWKNAAFIQLDSDFINYKYFWYRPISELWPEWW
jgi:hypothetical protein